MRLFYYYLDLIQHKLLVFGEVIKICYTLIVRALLHDLSKFSFYETEGYCQVVRIARKYEYNSKEYKQLMNQIRPYLLSHYQKNDHHPYKERKINNMNIYSLIEMVCDWKAATKRSAVRTIEDSFLTNKKKFNINKQLYNLLKTI